MTEPDVTLTDYALVVACALFTALLCRGGAVDRPLRRGFVLFFVAGGVASLTAGTVHGFFEGSPSVWHAVLWRAAMIAVGVGALAGSMLGARLALGPVAGRWVVRIAVLVFLLYTGTILLVSDRFRVAVAAYLPAALFLLVALGVAHLRERRPGAGLAAGGLGLTFVAAAIQQLRLSPDPAFDHNALYHTVQGAGLFLIFLGARRLIGARLEPGGS